MPALAAEIRELRRKWRKSDNEYRAYPIASCQGWRLVEERVMPCPNTAVPSTRPETTVLCRVCRGKEAREIAIGDQP
jgi:hypothetical protein